MGTKQTRQEKISYVRAILAKSKENKKGYARKMIEANLMLKFCCNKRTAEEIIQAFINSNEAEEVLENGEQFLYG